MFLNAECFYGAELVRIWCAPCAHHLLHVRGSHVRISRACPQLFVCVSQRDGEVVGQRKPTRVHAVATSSAPSSLMTVVNSNGSDAQAHCYCIIISFYTFIVFGLLLHTERLGNHYLPRRSASSNENGQQLAFPRVAADTIQFLTLHFSVSSKHFLCLPVELDPSLSAEDSRTALGASYLQRICSSGVASMTIVCILVV